ncbi:hypothetical protein IWT25_00672 [Secundilactobacillus pentosiphilus]|uniref:Uncharacterized protein n=1 Tax=Secundilactobacillus pentosiphilus TaxID=1714682 RepID=A0A1Z5IUS4_9LACO|nr:hypothetical protein [Secundilactobacillus pentosiphilus]GAX05368.1 hypothetical protein IWT25_00672 [Secundilactobacillus pentosiphilus]
MSISFQITNKDGDVMHPETDAKNVTDFDDAVEDYIENNIDYIKKLINAKTDS